MAVKANTFRSTDAVGNREELSNIVDITERRETPVYSMIGNGKKAKTTNPEWEIDTLDAPGDNAQEEGSEYDFDALDPVDRMGNHTQIFRKTGRTSQTQEAVDNAGQAETLNRKKILKGIALRKDVEFSLVAAHPSVGGATRKSGSLSTWAETNVSRGAGGANGGYNSSTRLTEAPTNGTQRAFTKQTTDEVLRLGFDSGANLKHAFMTSYNKEVFAGFMTNADVAQLRMPVTKGGKATLYGDVEVYRGPNGLIYVHPNAVMSTNADTARNVLMLDPTKLAWRWLRKVKEDKDLAKTGSAKQFALEGEGTLEVSNEKAVGVVADTFGLSATT
ncbi:SU10 major capsid protein [Leisingera sp. NJS204]|uniref:SU10 major capsid protein n=1 Tax=Leisingera sp. NJS204 TaxID=2508307 RepID=UPI0013E92D0F|nr:DUF5309 family protein [Leisingera sp. NJS204]